MTMRRKLLVFAAALSLMTGFVDRSTAQFRSKGMRVGVAGALLGGPTRASSREVDFAGGAFVRHNLANFLDGDFTATMGNLRGKGYQSDVYSAEYKVLYKFASGQWEPYAGVGWGLAYYYANPNFRDPAVPKDGYVAYLPVALGLEYAMDDFWTLTANTNLNYAFSGNMVTSRLANSGLKTGNDAWIGASLGLSVSLFGNDNDADNDGLMQTLEKKHGTDPENSDTDGDELSDGDELNRSRTNPLQKDTDGDGLSDGDEFLKHKTDPNSADSDSDKLSDAEEVMKTETNPLASDTDGDGLTDGDERMTRKTDPLKTDTDGDHLGDGEEALRFKTDPLKADTDGDGLSDGDELQKSKTDPFKADSDGDVLSDGDEVVKYRTDPLKSDTDGDEFNDGLEVLNFTNPLDPKIPAKEVPKPVETPKADGLKAEVGKPIILEGVTFKPGSIVVQRQSESALARALFTFIENPTIEVEIRGYTDNTGNAEKNVQLSQRRADAVKIWLIQRGIPAARITAKGYGSANPVADNSTADGRAQNRRIEFIRTK